MNGNTELALIIKVTRDSTFFFSVWDRHLAFTTDAHHYLAIGTVKVAQVQIVDIRGCPLEADPTATKVSTLLQGTDITWIKLGAILAADILIVANIFVL